MDKWGVRRTFRRAWVRWIFWKSGETQEWILMWEKRFTLNSCYAHKTRFLPATNKSSAASNYRILANVGNKFYKLELSEEDSELEFLPEIFDELSVFRLGIPSAGWYRISSSYLGGIWEFREKNNQVLDTDEIWEEMRRKRRRFWCWKDGLRLGLISEAAQHCGKGIGQWGPRHQPHYLPPSLQKKKERRYN